MDCKTEEKVLMQFKVKMPIKKKLTIFTNEVCIVFCKDEWISALLPIKIL